VPPRWLAAVPGDAVSRWPSAPVPAAPAPRWPVTAGPGDAGPCWPVAPGPAPAVPVAAGRAPADPAGGPEGAGPACPGAVPRGAAGPDPDPVAADGSASVPALAGPPAGCRELPRRGRGTLRALLGCSCSGAPGFQRAEIGRLEIVISPVSGRPFSFGWLGSGGGAGAGWALFSPPLPDSPLSDPPRPVAARARDFHRPDRAAAASRLLCSAASLECSRSTTASGSPRSLRVLSTTAGSAVSRPPDRCSIYSRVRARNARLSSDWSLVRAATERRLR
jgi:hypothetical protein